jgi:hypothetical protein
MDEDVSVRPKRKKIFRLILVLFFVMILLAGGFLAFKYYQDKNSPFPRKIRQNVSFTLYYPQVIPAGYKYQTGSTHIENGVVFLKLKDGDKAISISEQAVPTAPPDLNSLTGLGFKKVETLAGSIALGNNGGIPTAVILNQSSLVTVTGTKGVPLDQVGKIAQSLQSVD